MNCRKKLVILSFIFCFFTFQTSLFAQPDSTSEAGVMDQALVPARILAARHEFNINNMRGALTIYREVLDADPANASAMYGIAECHYNLKKYPLAKDYLDRAVKIRGNLSSETELFYGKIYHRLADLDQAMEYYKLYESHSKKGTFELAQAQTFIHQCEFAKELMSHPADVSVKNMGEVINTRYEDYTPSITADGRMMVFTSRRSDTKGGEIDNNGDYKYYEDIYFSIYDSATDSWSQSEGLPGDVNTETHDAVLGITPDGTGIFVYKNNGQNAGDIFYSKKNLAENTWYAAQKLDRPVNTSFYEGSVSMTADGNTLYFISERMEGMGLGDIYVSAKKGSGWSNPKNLGPLLNTDMDEKFVFIHPNGKTLFFASEGHQTMGSYDIFKTEMVNGEWSTPVNLGYPINTVNEESTFSLTADNKILLIAAEYDDSYGERDIYSIDVSRYPLLSKGYDKSTYGQLICVITHDKGKPAKDAKVEVVDAENGYVVAQSKSDKTGYARINLLGDKAYKIKVSYFELSAEQSVTLTLKKEGETVLKTEIKLQKSE